VHRERHAGEDTPRAEMLVQILDGDDRGQGAVIARMARRVPGS